MIYNFPYLNDTSFLKQFDNIKLKDQLAKIIVLTFDQKKIAEIQGVVTGGTINIDGTSAMRRTANINFIADPYENDLTNTKYLLSINKKVQLLIGFKNNTNKYLEYPILWFPQGIYVIISPNISRDSNGINISLTLHDKIALLNGECGGTFPATVEINQLQTEMEDGDIFIQEIPIFRIIQQLVHHWGGQQLGKILISDIDLKIKRVLKWTGSYPLFIYHYVTTSRDGSPVHEYKYSINKPELIATIKKNEPKLTDAIIGSRIQTFEYGDSVAYTWSDFIYQGELIANAGQTVITILDKIKNMLGNYEYFYDINGNFVFRQIRNYLNTTYATFKINQIQKENYLVDYVNGKSVYSFDDGHLILSYNNNPQYQQIKNDFLVWGIRQDQATGLNLPIRYHLAIDKKPTIGNSYEVFLYTDNDGIQQAAAPLKFKKFTNFPKVGSKEYYYYAEDQKKIYKWRSSDQKGSYKVTNYTTKNAPSTPIEYTALINFPTEGKLGVYYYSATQKKVYRWQPYQRRSQYVLTDYKLQSIKTYDFRTELYLQGIMAEANGLQTGYYYQQLKSEWCKIYDIKNHKFYDDVIQHPQNINFFLDFIDTTSAINEFNVNNIGRRTNVINNDKINCIFEPDFLNICFIETGTEETDILQQQCKKANIDYIQISSQVYSNFVTCGYYNSAYEQLKNEIYQYTNYNEQVSLNTVSIYYLQPNSRITIRDNASGIYGDYIIKNISLPLDVSGTMNISCVRALERI